jgi:hypothetical protein
LDGLDISVSFKPGPVLAPSVSEEGSCRIVVLTGSVNTDGGAFGRALTLIVENKPHKRADAINPIQVLLDGGQ